MLKHLMRLTYSKILTHIVKERKALMMKINNLPTKKTFKIGRDGCSLDKKSMVNFKRKKNARPRSRWPYLKVISQNVWEAFRLSKVKANSKLAKPIDSSRNCRLAKKNYDRRLTLAFRRAGALNFSQKAGGTWLKSKIKA